MHAPFPFAKAAKARWPNAVSVFTLYEYEWSSIASASSVSICLNRLAQFELLRLFATLARMEACNAWGSLSKLLQLPWSGLPFKDKNQVVALPRLR